MKDMYLKCFSEIYRLLPVIGILLLALLGIWWGSRIPTAVHSAQPTDSGDVSVSASRGDTH